MGCYHFHLNQLSRGKGQSAIASAAYRAGTKLECTYYGEVSDYTRKGGVVLAEIHLPQQAPERFKDRETLWNEVEWIEGIKVNVTLIFTANQALLAARAGAAYVSPFLGRLDDISVRGVDLITEVAEIFAVSGIDTEIIAASVRNPIHVTDCALAGADIATVPYAVIEKMIHHPLTDQGIEKFQADYRAVFGE